MKMLDGTHYQLGAGTCRRTNWRSDAGIGTQSHDEVKILALYSFEARIKTNFRALYANVNAMRISLSQSHARTLDVIGLYR